MKNFIAALLMMVSTLAFGQAYTAVTATGITVDNGSGTAINPPSGANLCFLGVNYLGATITYTPQGGSPTSGAVCQTFNGSGGLTGSLQVANPATASPAGLRYTITITSGGTTYLTIPAAQLSGTLFQFATYALPVNGSASGVGYPHIACTAGAQWTSTTLPSGSDAKTCANVSGVGTWTGYPQALYCPTGLAYQTPQGNGNPNFCLAPIFAGTGAPTGACLKYSQYFQQDAPGTAFACYNSAWVQTSGSGSAGLTSFQGRTTAAATLQPGDVETILSNGPFNMTGSQGLTFDEATGTIQPSANWVLGTGANAGQLYGYKNLNLAPSAGATNSIVMSASTGAASFASGQLTISSAGVLTMGAGSTSGGSPICTVANALCVSTPSLYYQTVQNSGTSITQRGRLNFVTSTGISSVDDSPNASTDISLSNIPNSALANSSITLNFVGGATGGGTVSLGGTSTITVTAAGGTISFGGDLSGSSTSQTVVGVHATTGTLDGVPIGSSTPSTGAFSALTVGGNAVCESTGTNCPSSGGFTAGGDLSGSSTNQTVIGIHATSTGSIGVTSGNGLNITAPDDTYSAIGLFNVSESSTMQGSITTLGGGSSPVPSWPVSSMVLEADVGPLILDSQTSEGVYFQNGRTTYAYVDANGLHGAIGATAPNTGVFTTADANVYVSARSNSPSMTAQGGYLEWNIDSGQGETDFVNLKGTGVGGFSWYNGPNASSLVQLMALNSSGQLTANGVVSNGFTGPIGNSSASSGQFTSLQDTALGSGCVSSNSNGVLSNVSCFDPASPGPIGSTTPYAGAFTSLTANGQNVCESNGTNCPPGVTSVTMGGDVTGNSASSTVASVHATSGTLNGVTIGVSTPSTGSFTSLTDTSLTSGSCMQVGTGGLLTAAGDGPCVSRGGLPTIAAGSALGSGNSVAIGGSDQFHIISFTVASATSSGNLAAVTLSAPRPGYYSVAECALVPLNYGNFSALSQIPNVVGVNSTTYEIAGQLSGSGTSVYQFYMICY